MFAAEFQGSNYISTIARFDRDDIGSNRMSAIAVLPNRTYAFVPNPNHRGFKRLGFPQIGGRRGLTSTALVLTKRDCQESQSETLCPAQAENGTARCRCASLLQFGN